MEYPDVNAIFTDLTRDIPAPKNGTDIRYFLDDDHTESINDIKDALVSSLIDQLATIDKYNDEPDEDPTSTIKLLTLCVNRDFIQMDGLNIGDEIIADGNSIFLLVDQGYEFDVLPILEGMQIVGTLEYIVVSAIPAIHALPSIRNQNEIYIEGLNPLPTIPHGVLMLLKNAFSVDEHGSIQPLPEDMTVAIPLNYDQLNLRRTV